MYHIFMEIVHFRPLPQDLAYAEGSISWETYTNRLLLHYNGDEKRALAHRERAQQALWDRSHLKGLVVALVFSGLFWLGVAALIKLSFF